MITVLTWYWQQPGGRAQYSAAHVNVWAGMVRRHLSMPHRIACVTDTPEGIDPSVEIIVPPRDFEAMRIPTWGPDKPQCLRRIAMFASDAGEVFGERFVCMDLDVIVSGSLDQLFDRPDDFVIFNGTAQKRPYNGSMMMLRAGTRTKVYSELTVEKATQAGRLFVGSDQAWITHCLGPREKTWGPGHGAYWYRQPEFNRHRARVTFFPGGTKPWQITQGDPWAMANYRAALRGRCLILGYAPNVWDEAAEAMADGPVDAVIASPEAAEHWPGDVLAIAHSDSQADALAYMHGFETVVFCGRTEKAAA